MCGCFYTHIATITAAATAAAATTSIAASWSRSCDLFSPFYIEPLFTIASVWAFLHTPNICCGEVVTRIKCVGRTIRMGDFPR